MISRHLRWLQPVVVAVAVVAVVAYLGAQWSTVRAHSWRLDWGWLTAATALLVVTWAVEVEIWRRLLAQLGGRIPFLAAVRIWMLSAVVRYVPGNIWQPLSLTLYAARHGVTPEATIAAIGLYQGVILLAATPFAALYVFAGGAGSLLGDLTHGLSPWLLVPVIAPAALFLLRPDWLFALLNRLLVAVGRKPLTVTITGPALTALVGVAIVDWALWGATFAALTFGVAGEETASWASLAPLLITAYPLAYTVGFLSLITPSGFGVREGALYLLLVPRLDGAVVTVVALAMRLFTTLFELLAALVSAPYERGPAATAEPSSAAAIRHQPG